MSTVAGNYYRSEPRRALFLGSFATRTPFSQPSASIMSAVASIYFRPEMPKVYGPQTCLGPRWKRKNGFRGLWSVWCQQTMGMLGAHSPWASFGLINLEAEGEGRLNGALGTETPGKRDLFGSHLGVFHPEDTFLLLPCQRFLTYSKTLTARKLHDWLG